MLVVACCLMVVVCGLLYVGYCMLRDACWVLVIDCRLSFAKETPTDIQPSSLLPPPPTHPTTTPPPTPRPVGVTNQKNRQMCFVVKCLNMLFDIAICALVIRSSHSES